ncbi:hypothetical protein ABT160_39670 [Streptomyces sp. NPDC001941]|uniref:hypothetical protein n=1 Tax=Streptomyces sp. NPDC001941 TaxID=3154659 RepID=UPI003321A18D
MTQSGQGQEPPHEGVVLPADGSGPWPQQAGRTAPPAGQDWGGPWGPGQHQGGQHQGGGQPLPPQSPAPAEEDATQFIPPVGAGPLPPESPAESTTYLGTGPLVPPSQAHQPPQQGYGYPPQAAPGHPGRPDEQATQYLPPVPAQEGDRRPPAEFDSLFRSDATQQMPPVRDQGPAQPQYQQPPQGGYGYPQPQSPQRPAYGYPHPQSGPPQQPHQQGQFGQGGYGHPPQQPGGPQPAQGGYDPYEPEPERRRRSPAVVIAAVVVGCAVVGLGAGALLSGGDDSDKGKDTGQPVANSSAAPSGGDKTGEQPKADDPVKKQAQELDKLLADSNNSRAAVIRSVDSIKRCQNLDQAATDLRGAAQQRRDLVTRLQGLSVDRLPDHAALTDALTRAWQASASADDHYAAWAGQAKGDKGCKDGHARGTGQAVQGNKASGEATSAKREASKLWNSIAGRYELTKREPTQL